MTTTTPGKLLTDCLECNRCLKVCDFLQQHGNPVQIELRLSARLETNLPYSCSLCGACESVCPANIPLKQYFLAWRQIAVARGLAPLPAHRGLLNYEKMVASKLLTAVFLPPGTARVLFPGCAAIGKAPATVKTLYRQLAAIRPEENLGLVLDCCHKISHDLGRQSFFQEKFFRLRQQLQAAGVREIITLCPSCTEIFRSQTDFTVTPVYHYLRRLPPAAGDTQRLVRAAVHDACVLRHDRETQDAVRGLLSDRKITPVPLAQERKHTLCCGEGGAAWCLDRNLPERFRQRRLAGLTDPLVVYCYACRDFLDPDHQLGIRHILEIVCGPEKRYAGWRSWLNRFFLKRWLRRKLAHRI